MRIPPSQSRRRARIEIIPLIDVVFFLLATFVMVSLSMVKNLGIPVHLPVASSSVLREERDLHTLTVTEEDDLYFNKEKISLEGLRERLQSLKAVDPDPRVIINGDEKALFGSAIMVLDEVRKTGITKVSIQTKGKTDS